MAIERMTYREAIIRALGDELRFDDSVILIGEDIGESGGVFKTTEGLFEEFGADRILETPIAETGFVGAALGVSVAGFRPVVEIMFGDFLGVCYDQIVNSIAKHRFMSGGRMISPIVIRTACGGGLQFGAQHSQTAESWLLSVPGLKLVLPATPTDVYTMLRASIRDDNPVIFFEHKELLASKGDVDTAADLNDALSGPRIVRTGDDVTIVASLAMVRRALEAAEELAGNGIAAEVIDLRVLRPLDSQSIAESVRKTGRLVTVEEQAVLGGWGGEVVATIVNEAFDYLDSPPHRIGMSDHPLPFSNPLEEASRPTASRIAAEIRAIE